ncbi:MAG: PadR family transcriptional regulator [Terriglobia bacterium]
MTRNQTRYLILGMLSIEPNLSGYDIRKAVESSVSYFWRESYGQIYPTLQRLTGEGLISTHPSKTKGRRQRQEYSLTARGRACLQEWLTAPHREDPPRNEFLLKLFFGRSAAPEECRQHVKDFQEKNKHLLAVLEQLQTQAQTHNTGNPHLPFWMLTLSFGIAQVRASIAWSESALSILSPANTGAAASSENRPKRI